MSEVARAVKQAHEMFLAYKKIHLEKGKEDECKSMITAMKIQFMKFPTFLNPDVQTPTRTQEVMIVREAMEHAVLLAVATKNMNDFEKHFEILRVYYTDFPDEPKSERRLLILGLHLLRLLAVNKTRAYHMELERIAVTDQDNMYIKDVVQLERYNMEGSYHKMLQARSKVPSSHYVPLMEMLLETVRREVFRCAMGAYESLSVDGARRLLMFENNDDLKKFIQAEKEARGEEMQGWDLVGEEYTFVHQTSREGTLLPFMTIINDNLKYSNELQRIV
eukprot:TRINITY_DN1103_c0_g1_i4.p1 TRINITY_DN1103_c0_g1~~TRINITY_DN1103_c0_g1_i4.p1  ORF type:complete len:277 (+),score=77.64 TRINITY_DN1103_c0_g1_i4:57-887(+)